MASRKIHTGTYLWGATMSMISLLTGAWLMVAPFALGYQRSGANWTGATSNSFWFGLAILVVSLIGVQLFTWSVLRQARQAGVLAKQRRRATLSAAEAQTRLTDLERTLTQLAAVLATDHTARRNGDINRDPDVLANIPEPVASGR